MSRFFSWRRKQHEWRLVATALNYMPHGFCMFGPDKRLVLCNDEYASMYGLPPELRKAGTTHDDIIAHRVQSGLLHGDKTKNAVEKKISELGTAFQHQGFSSWLTGSTTDA